jgi:formylglycine-generating enzyme required for sulfatase activity
MDWNILAKAVGGAVKFHETKWDGAGKALKAKIGWIWGNGTDDYGFAALPGGHRAADDRRWGKFNNNLGFQEAVNAGFWWTTTEAGAGDNVYIRRMSGYSHELTGSRLGKECGLSVRCVMDDGNKRTSAQKTKRPAPTGGKPEIEMVSVKGGTFKMGYGGNEKRNRRYSERAHNVTVGDFYMGRYEVTQKQWMQVMGGNPSAGALGDDYPVNSVSWDDIAEFIKRLNAATGKKYRLPTEAEWEYAARGGAIGKGYEYSGSDNPDDVAWHAGNSDGEAHPAGTKAPNELGLYDMTGNVWELLSDWIEDYGMEDQINPTGPKEGVNRVGRGCSWSRAACRVYDRGYSPNGESSYDTGFRLVLLP